MRKCPKSKPECTDPKYGKPCVHAEPHEYETMCIAGKCLRFSSTEKKMLPFFNDKKEIIAEREYDVETDVVYTDGCAII